MKLLQVKNLYLQYNYGALALQNINFEAKQGQVLTVMSQSEGGKTSLVKGLAGLYKITRGECVLNGKTINNLPLKERNLSVMYEDGGFFKERTVFYNLIYPLKIRKTDKLVAESKINGIIEEFGLNEFKNTKIKKLNKEIKFKTALARLFVRESDLYLIDDPLKVFDYEERKTMFEYMLPYIKKLNSVAPLIYATSSVEESITLGDNVVLLNFGVLLQAGSVGSIVTRPISLLSYKLFHSGVITEEVTLLNNDEGVYLELNDNKIFINPSKLINKIYIGSNILASFLKKEDAIDIPTLRLFDKSSEKLIYFN